MPESTAVLDRQSRPAATLPIRNVRRVPVVALGASLAAFLALTFVLCVLFDLWFPALAMHSVWAPLLPGFAWISWTSFLLGLVEAFAYGWYIGFVLGSLYNLFARVFARNVTRRISS